MLLTRQDKSRRSDELTSGGCGLTPLPIIESEFKKNVTRRTETKREKRIESFEEERREADARSRPSASASSLMNYSPLISSSHSFVLSTIRFFYISVGRYFISESENLHYWESLSTVDEDYRSSLSIVFLVAISLSDCSYYISPIRCLFTLQ